MVNKIFFVPMYYRGVNSETVVTKTKESGINLFLDNKYSHQVNKGQITNFTRTFLNDWDLEQLASCPKGEKGLNKFTKFNQVSLLFSLVLGVVVAYHIVRSKIFRDGFC